jgi:solute:Na+ symporter, SSS family
MSTTVGTGLDYGIIVAYFIIVLGFGSIFGRHTHSTKDFFFGGQRFSWWIIAFSLVATTVGSYSFIKYSRVAFTHGLSSTMSYTNDWFWMPLFAVTWMPIIFYSRVTSVPEYFERRFDRRVRIVTTIFMMTFLLGSIGINLLTMGVALRALLGWNIYFAAGLVAIVCGIYVTFGGQTSVIMTDLLQGLLLLFAGLWLFALGLDRLGGLGEFWANMPRSHRLPLNYFNSPPDFNFIGVFWQDGVCNNMFFYFLNQGMVMRFLSAKSPREGRKAVVFLMLVLQIVAAVAVSNAGWIGRAMVNAGLLPADMNPQEVFVRVAAAICQPGVFGFVMAALTAALMSTADSLLNATSAVAVNDIYRPFINPKAPDQHYLKVARYVSMGSALLGFASVPLFASFKSIYAAHGAFTAMITPPMAAAVVLGAFWRRFNTKGALWAVVGGAMCIGLSIIYPDVIEPFSFGTPRGGEFMKAWQFQRAIFGLTCSMALGIVGSWLGPKPDADQISGLVWGTLNEARRRFKGGKPNLSKSTAVRLNLEESVDENEEDFDDAYGYADVQIAAADRKRLTVEPGDIVQIAHVNPIYGGLRSVQTRVADAESNEGAIRVPRYILKRANLVGLGQVRVERII